MEKTDNLFDRRVGESEVARILQLISELPNRRGQARPGDITGDFDFWFDGGACRVQTGWQEFVFANGTRAHLAAPIPSLSLTIEFADGRQVDIRQTKR